MDILNGIEAYKLDWNPITVEGYNSEKNEVVMVFNVDITVEEKTANVIQYIFGRTIWCIKNFPSNVKIMLSFDIRGQGIIMSRSNSIKQKILELINSIGSKNQISIEFLR